MIKAKSYSIIGETGKEKSYFSMILSFGAII